MTKTPATTTDLINAIRSCKTAADRSRMGAFLSEYFAAVAKFNPHHAQIMVVEQVAKAAGITVTR